MRASVISTRTSHAMKIDRTSAKEIKTSKMGFLGIGVTLQKLIDKALKEAGPEYDLLIDAVIDLKDYFFVSGYQVTGFAISTEKLKAQLGEDGFNKLLETTTYYSYLGEE